MFLKCMKKSLFLSLVITTMVLMLPAQQATAQQVGALNLEEIIVTSRRREESLQDVPLSVNAFSADEMDLRGMLDITDIAAATPNVNMDSTSNTSGLTGSPTVFIRGIGQADFVINTDPAVGIYIDGVYMARSLGSMMDLVDLERAEILRGPQGTLFGRNSLAGAVNLISKRPSTEAFEANLKAVLGEQGYQELGASVNMPISDRTAARFSVMSRQQDGYVQALQYDDFWLGSEDKKGLRGQLEFLPTDNLRINLSADYSKTNGSPGATVPTSLGSAFGDTTNATVESVQMGGAWWNTSRPMGLPAFSGDPSCKTQAGRLTNTACHGMANVPANKYATNAIWYNERNERVAPDNEIEIRGTTATIEYDVGPGTIKLISAYRKFETYFMNDNDYGPHALSGNINEEFYQDQTSHELQFNGQAGDGKLDYTVGLYTFEESGRETVTLIGVNGLQITMGSSGGVFQSIVRDMDNESDAMFGQLTYNFDIPLHLTLGIRKTKDTKSFVVTPHRDFCPSRTTPNTANGDGVVIHDQVTDICGGATGSSSWDETDPMVSLSYDISDSSMVYGTFSTGFRDGGFASRFPDGLPNPIPAFRPEYVESYEIGAKMTMLDGRLRLNASLFKTNYTDMQVTAQPVDIAFGGTGINNVGAASLDGFELDGMFAVSDNLRLDFTLGLLDAGIDNLLGGTLASGPFNITKDATLPYTPETNYTVGATWRIPLSSGANITSRLDWIHTDEMRWRLESHPLTGHPAYDRANFSATYNNADADWALTFGVRNLTDEMYSTAGTYSTGNAHSSTNRSRPRQAFLRLQYWMDQ
ncbi:MAG: TonB-dependent receptor [Arenicellaceae bacterium]|nr:TonB-dependent receptor [Arenicellaceae bacterium]